MKVEGELVKKGFSRIRKGTRMDYNEVHLGEYDGSSLCVYTSACDMKWWMDNFFS